MGFDILCVHEKNIKEKGINHHSIGDYTIDVITLKNGEMIAGINGVSIEPNSVASIRKKINRLVEESIMMSSSPISTEKVVEYVDGALKNLSLNADEGIVAAAYRSGIKTYISKVLLDMEHKEKKIKSEMVPEFTGLDNVRSVRKYQQYFNEAGAG